MARGEEGLQVLRDHVVEHRAAGIPRCVGSNRWRHTSPHVQVGSNGSARSCHQLYCSFVQYTSKKLTRECGRNMRDASPCCCSHSVCAARRRWQKVRLKFLYMRL